MRNYEYFLYSNEPDEYGQSTLIKDEQGNPKAQGHIKIAVYVSSQAVQDNLKYKSATYIGLTEDANVSDLYVIDYNGTKLKVLYVNPQSRFKQVFMGEI